MSRRLFGNKRVAAPRVEAAALYFRVSSVRQLKGDVSIPSQRRAAVLHCAGLCIPCAAEFADAMTGTDDNRPEFQRMIEEALGPAPRFNTIIVYTLSRFFRSGPESELLMRKLARSGVRVVSVTQPIGDDPGSMMMRQIIQIFDEHTSRENGKNVRRAMLENARQGFWNGTPAPLGYRTYVAEMRGQKSKKRIEIDPVDANLVRTIYSLYLDGVPGRPVLGVKEVVKIINRRGLRTRSGALFGVGPVHNLLTSAHYASGWYPYGATDSETGEANASDTIVHIPMPPIIDQGIFDAVQAKLAARNPRIVPPRVVNGPSLLAGIAVCANCGAGMTRTGTTKRGRRYSYYSCAGCHQKGETACPGRHVPMEKLDGLVLTALKKQLLTPDRLRLLLQGLIERQASRHAEVSSRSESLRRQIEDVGERLKRLYALVEDGTAEIDDALRDRIKVLRGEKAKAESALERSASWPSRANDIDDEKIQRFGTLLSERLDEGDANARRGYIASVISRIEVGDGIVRVAGQTNTLAELVQRGDEKVNGFVRRWRGRRDSNPRSQPWQG
jgi:site-specific DNA recombinase